MLLSLTIQTGEHHGQHGAEAGEVRDEPGGTGAAQDGGTRGGEEENRLSSLPHAAEVRVCGFPPSIEWSLQFTI